MYCCLMACKKERCCWENVLIFMCILAIPQPLLEAVSSLQVELADTLVEITTLRQVMVAMKRAAMMNHPHAKRVEESPEWHRR